MHKRFTAIAVCCAAAASLAGCGSSGSSGSGTNKLGPNGTSVAVFRASLNAECQQGNAAVAAAGNNQAKVLGIVNRILSKLKTVNAPSSLQAVYVRFLANLEAEAAAVQAGNNQAVQQAKAKNAAFAKQLGAPACAGK